MGEGFWKQSLQHYVEHILMVLKWLLNVWICEIKFACGHLTLVELNTWWEVLDI